ncbi:hypothetical protein F5884DRAFT_665220 [Xylogone sp. PMI_703]|nr:hypothetical protein F5884DRAFT_665220 [Xylogone sp. PMI_703]
MDPQTDISALTEEDYLALEELDPSPIQSPEDEDRNLSKSLSPGSRPLGFGLGSRSAGYYLSRVQKYSSYTFAVFASLHLTNTSIIPLITRSVPASEPYLLLTRPFYQSAFFEPIVVILPITAHVLSGLALRVRRRNQTLVRYGAANISIAKRLQMHLKVWPPVSWTSVSGYILTPLVLGHAYVNRFLPWLYEGGSSSVGLAYVSHGFAKHPAISYAAYGAIVGFGAGHFIWGMSRWMGWLPTGKDKKAKRRWWTLHGVSALLTALWMAGGLGVIANGGKAEGWEGKGYDQLLSKVPLIKLD